MYNILHVMGGADVGGVSAVVLNYYRHMNREKFHFDIAINADSFGRDGKEFQLMGSTIYRLPQKHRDMSGFTTGLRKILTDKHYDAIHVHHNETSYVALRIAKQMGIPCRIAHSHSTSPASCLKDELRRVSGCVLNAYYATQVVGCGRLAGERVFGKFNMKRPIAHVLPNAIDTERFGYSEKYRNEVRNEYALDSGLVLGMVGRLSPEKNHMFALKVLAALREKKVEASLVLVGAGEMEEQIRSESKNLGLQDSVVFTGSRNDAERFYSAFDVLLMPSLFEGFPVVAVEAMASGLPLLLSDRITKEFSFGSAVRYLPLDNAAEWAEAAMEVSALQGREIRQLEAKQHGFDIHDSAAMLEDIYMKDLAK